MRTTDSTPVISRIYPDGTIVETIHDPAAAATALAVRAANGETSILDHFNAPTGERLVPYSADNNLLTSGCVLLPSTIGDVGDKGDVIQAISDYLDRYVDLAPAFREIVPYYVLLTWVYDAFNELPYLRALGSPGQGKTRRLIAVGSICYKPFFASGASTVSPIFHILDTFRGTLVLDEADLRFSDATADLTKVLNNGTVNGLPVLRTMTNRAKELNPQAFRVFGPKLLAMRQPFQDDALETRFLTEHVEPHPLPAHIPIHQPASLAAEAAELRNMLLAWRLRERWNVGADQTRRIMGASPRANQTALALMSLIDDAGVRERLADFMLQDDKERSGARLRSEEGQVLAATLEAFAASPAPTVPVASITDIFNRNNSESLEVSMSPKWIGSKLRTRLRIETVRSHGTYGVPRSERPNIERLAARFGIHTERSDEGANP